MVDSALTVENLYLRQQLQSLLAKARQNEEKMRRFDQIERSLIGIRSLAELVHFLLKDFREAFRLDELALLLVDPEYEISRVLEQQGAANKSFPGLVLLEDAKSIAALYPRNRPYLGPYQPGRGTQQFPAGVELASVALLPLLRQDSLIGALHLGSASADRFSADSSTDFLERLTSIASICLENALNHERLQSLGLTDGLTGIHNRRYFESRCLEEVALAQRNGGMLSCMFFDLDHFKQINDRWGHQAGDEALRKVASIIKLTLRSCDVLARYGGEEFVALLPQTSLIFAREIAERIRNAIAAHAFELVPGEAPLVVTASIGVSVLPLDAGPLDPAALAERMIATADQALYQAKHGGRNRVVAMHDSA